jgi:hypothetical protein
MSKWIHYPCMYVMSVLTMHQAQFIWHSSMSHIVRIAVFVWSLPDRLWGAKPSTLILIIVFFASIGALYWLDQRWQDQTGFGMVDCWADNIGAVVEPDRVLQSKVLDYLGMPTGSFPRVIKASYVSDSAYWYMIYADETRWKQLLEQMKTASKSGTRIWKVSPIEQEDPNISLNLTPAWWPRLPNAKYDTWLFISSEDTANTTPSTIIFKIGYEYTTNCIYIGNNRG